MGSRPRDTYFNGAMEIAFSGAEINRGSSVLNAKDVSVDGSTILCQNKPVLTLSFGGSAAEIADRMFELVKLLRQAQNGATISKPYTTIIAQDEAGRPKTDIGELTLRPIPRVPAPV